MLLYYALIHVLLQNIPTSLLVSLGKCTSVEIEVFTPTALLLGVLFIRGVYVIGFDAFIAIGYFFWLYGNTGNGFC